MKYPLPLLLAAFMTLFSAHSFAQRQVIELSDGWKFVKHEVAPDAPVSDEWQPVTVPHCWNALDGQNGKAADPEFKDGYYRGPAWYERTLDIPADWKDRRVFIRFGAAFLVADVYLNGEHLGQHRGGFAAFCYELTDKLKFGAPNELRVRVDNAKNPDVAPLGADFTMEGGIYRPVQLLVTDKLCISPLDFGGPGMYVTPSKISVDGADVAVEVKLLRPEISAQASLPHSRYSQFPLSNIVIRDAQDKIVCEQTSAAVGPSLVGRFHLDHPHLWNGIKDPYTYTVEVELTFEGKIVDDVTQPLGFRTVEISQEKGFLLNGQPYPIHGVNRHQEKRDEGWALSDADHDADFQMIREMGATAVRLAHYQQAEHVHDLADKNGLLLWQEIPLVNQVGGSEAFLDNAKQQLIEMIRQGYNHPSIMTWSLFNELVGSENPPTVPVITALDKLARELDPTRTPASVTCHADKLALDRITEWVGCNIYPGWYGGVPDDFDKDVQKYWEAVGGNKRIAVTEYGAGANPAQHQEGAPVQPKPSTGPFHPEEWQAFVHERDWAQAKDNPHLWGTFLWVMFDFASDGRNEGSNPGVNDKGMVTEDRKIKKDAFYFYKANWNPEPMVYLASRRSTPRTEAQTEVKAYSNCPEVELWVNGQKIGVARPDDERVCRWPNVKLKPDANRVEIFAHAADGKALSDRCEWMLQPPIGPSAP